MAIAMRHRWDSTKATASKSTNSDESYSSDDQSSTSGSEISDEYVPESSCNLLRNRNEKQASQIRIFFSKIIICFNIFICHYIWKNKKLNELVGNHNGYLTSDAYLIIMQIRIRSHI